MNLTALAIAAMVIACLASVAALFVCLVLLVRQMSAVMRQMSLSLAEATRAALAARGPDPASGMAQMLAPDPFGPGFRLPPDMDTPSPGEFHGFQNGEE